MRNAPTLYSLTSDSGPQGTGQLSGPVRRRRQPPGAYHTRGTHCHSIGAHLSWRDEGRQVHHESQPARTRKDRLRSIRIDCEGQRLLKGNGILVQHVRYVCPSQGESV